MILFHHFIFTKKYKLILTLSFPSSAESNLLFGHVSDLAICHWFESKSKQRKLLSGLPVSKVFEIVKEIFIVIDRIANWKLYKLFFLW